MAVPVDRRMHLRQGRIRRQPGIDGGPCSDEAEIGFYAADDPAPLHGRPRDHAAGKTGGVDKVKLGGSRKAGFATAGEIARVNSDIGPGPARHDRRRRRLQLRWRGRRSQIGRGYPANAAQCDDPACQDCFMPNSPSCRAAGCNPQKGDYGWSCIIPRRGRHFFRGFAGPRDIP